MADGGVSTSQAGYGLYTPASAGPSTAQPSPKEETKTSASASRPALPAGYDAAEAQRVNVQTRQLVGADLYDAAALGNISPGGRALVAQISQPVQQPQSSGLYSGAAPVKPPTSGGDNAVLNPIQVAEAPPAGMTPPAGRSFKSQVMREVRIEQVRQANLAAMSSQGPAMTPVGVFTRGVMEKVSDIEYNTPSAGMLKPYLRFKPVERAGVEAGDLLKREFFEAARGTAYAGGALFTLPNRLVDIAKNPIAEGKLIRQAFVESAPKTLTDPRTYLFAGLMTYSAMQPKLISTKISAPPESVSARVAQGGQVQQVGFREGKIINVYERGTAFTYKQIKTATDFSQRSVVIGKPIEVSATGLPDIRYRQRVETRIYAPGPNVEFGPTPRTFIRQVFRSSGVIPGEKTAPATIYTPRGPLASGYQVSGQASTIIPTRGSAVKVFTVKSFETPKMQETPLGRPELAGPKFPSYGIRAGGMEGGPLSVGQIYTKGPRGYSLVGEYQSIRPLPAGPTRPLDITPPSAKPTPVGKGMTQIQLAKVEVLPVKAPDIKPLTVTKALTASQVLPLTIPQTIQKTSARQYQLYTPGLYQKQIPITFPAQKPISLERMSRLQTPEQIQSQGEAIKMPEPAPPTTQPPSIYNPPPPPPPPPVYAPPIRIGLPLILPSFGGGGTGPLGGRGIARKVKGSLKDLLGRTAPPPLKMPKLFTTKRRLF